MHQNMIQRISASPKSSSNINPAIKKAITGLFIISIILMLYNYQAGYSSSIDWEVTTTGEIIEFPALTFNKGLMEHQIIGEKYLLQERYSGGEIERSFNTELVYLSLIWIGLCITLAASTYFNRYLFFAAVAAFALLINRLNLYEVGLFGVESKLVLLIPFVVLVGPLVYFHEYRKSTPFIWRLGTLLVLSIALCFGMKNKALFVDHFVAHSIFSFGICTLLFLFIVAEEIIYAMLYVVTSSKGGKSNHIHFIILSLIYVGNLALYYLNKSGLFVNSFFFFDPFILLVVSSLVAIWSLKFKDQLVESLMQSGIISIVGLGLGILSMGFFSFSMQRGMDVIYESFHYFILYFHIGFGLFLFIYTIANFIDPLIKGFEIHKIVYRERNFPYATSRIGGIVCICAFYFLSGQEAYNLLRSGYYNYLSVKEESHGDIRLANEYLIHGSFLGYNNHYSNYNLAWKEWNKGKQFAAGVNFFNAAQRFPSPYAWVNYGNIESPINPIKVRATYEEALRWLDSPEMRNNLGIILMENGDTEKALDYFEKEDASNNWNQAPLVNKWNVYKKIETIDSSALLTDFTGSNYGVRSNILTTLTSAEGLEFNYETLDTAALLHRQAYLLNSSYLFDHDSIDAYLRKEIVETTQTSTANRLSKAQAIYLYRKGEVNRAFQILDELQANAHQYYKGEYLDALGKLAFDQGAYQLSIDFFDRALEVKYYASEINRLDPLAALGKKDSFANSLLKILKKDPGLTNYANDLLSLAETYNPVAPTRDTPDLSELSESQLNEIGSQNAFNVSQVIAVVKELDQKEASGSYELLVEAIAINPYSPELLSSYAMKALDWNLNEYADQAAEKLKSLMYGDEYSKFMVRFEEKKKLLQEESW